MLRRMEMLQKQPATEVPAAPAPAAASANNGDQPSQELIGAVKLQISLSQHTVYLGDKSVMLKPKEFDLLVFLARHRGQVLTRETLLERVWDYDYSGGTRTVDVHIRWIREKIEVDLSRPRYIHTVFGVGYKFDPELAVNVAEPAATVK